jgi:predicted small lipoprotein YifL
MRLLSFTMLVLVLALPLAGCGGGGKDVAPPSAADAAKEPGLPFPTQSDGAGGATSGTGAPATGPGAGTPGAK